LSEEQIRRFDELGFAWSRASEWMRRFHELEAFKKEHGHCNLPRKSKTHAALGHWVHNQRQTKKRGKLGEEWIRRLDELGFIWSLEALWEKRFSELEAFTKEHGHCNPSVLSKAHATLGNWVSTQRHRRKQGRLSKERIRRLDELGINWGHAAKWEKRFSELEAFKREHGHCNVSTLSKTHATLGTWVHTQRHQRKQGILSEERIQRLDRLDFVWDGKQEPATADSSFQRTATQRSVTPCSKPSKN
jgi:hypothetical protein